MIPKPAGVDDDGNEKRQNFKEAAALTQETEACGDQGHVTFPGTLTDN